MQQLRFGRKILGQGCISSRDPVSGQDGECLAICVGCGGVGLDSRRGRAIADCPEAGPRRPGMRAGRPGLPVQSVWMRVLETAAGATLGLRCGTAIGRQQMLGDRFDDLEVAILVAIDVEIAAQDRRS